MHVACAADEVDAFAEDAVADDAAAVDDSVVAET